MARTNLQRIRQKFVDMDSGAWWGDDYDVRFYLISKFRRIKNQTVLDIGGGIGILSSEIDKTNFRVNLDVSFADLQTGKRFFGRSIQLINGSMTHISFLDHSFDCVVCAHVLELAHAFDKQNHNAGDSQFSVAFNLLSEIRRVLKPHGFLLLTTPNNEYYKSAKLSHEDLVRYLEQNFTEFSLEFYNTYPKLDSTHRKLNMANVIPKLLGWLLGREKTIQHLAKSDAGKNKYSVSFYVEAKNDPDPLN